MNKEGEDMMEDGEGRGGGGLEGRIGETWSSREIVSWLAA